MNSKLREKFRKLRVNSDQTNSSFDRFSDHLTEVIVGYLPIEDKFRFECLSKRIRNKMFANEMRFVLSTDCEFSSKMVIKIWLKVNYPVFEKVLRKLKSLKDIEVNGDIEVDTEVLELMAINCPLLQRLTFNASVYNLMVNDILNFGRKFGLNITYLAINEKFPHDLAMILLSLTPNLTTLNLSRHFKQDNCGQNRDWMKKLSGFQHLRHFILTADNTSDDSVENIGQCLPHLESIVIRTAKPITDKTFECLSRLKALKSVKVFSSSNLLVTNTGVKQLLDECLHLRRLDLSKKTNLYFSIETIQTIISRAEEWPRIAFRFVFQIKNYQKYENIFQNLPKNLVLKFIPPLEP